MYEHLGILGCCGLAAYAAGVILWRAAQRRAAFAGVCASQLLNPHHKPTRAPAPPRRPIFREIPRPIGFEPDPVAAEDDTGIRRPESIDLIRANPTRIPIAFARPAIEILIDRDTPVSAFTPPVELAVYLVSGDDSLTRASYTLDVMSSPPADGQDIAPEDPQTTEAQSEAPAASDAPEGAATFEEETESAVAIPTSHFDAPAEPEPDLHPQSEPESEPAEPESVAAVTHDAEVDTAPTTPEEPQAELPPEIQELPAPAESVAPPADTVQPLPSPAIHRRVAEERKQLEWNQTGIDYRAPMPWPKVRGPVIDFHCHLFAARHAKTWFETARHYGIDHFLTMTPLEECIGLQRDWPGRIHFIAVPQWMYDGPDFYDDWLRRIEMFYNLGSRIVKFHMAPQTIAKRTRLDAPELEPILKEVRARKMMIMTHVGDPETWYQQKYTDTKKYGTREEHYAMWEGVLAQFADTPWIGAHMGGNPEDLGRLQSLLDRYPNLMLDCSATRWMAREISNHRDEARDFFVRNADRILFGSDQVSGDDRGFDFLASRWWTHRKLWETAYVGPAPILDPDLPPDNQPQLRGLALPDEVLQKIYHDNATGLLARAGIRFGDPE